MKRLLHRLYNILFFLVCKFNNLIQNVKRKTSPIKEKSVMFTAHPDDETLFFYTVLKKEKPYVVLLTSGKSGVRMKEFKNAMKYYGVRYNYYPLDTRDERTEKLDKIVKKELKNSSFECCYTHNPDGEYGHVMHRRVSECVRKNFKGKTVVPKKVTEKSAENLLPDEVIKEKIRIFKTIYPSQDFVLEEYPEWVNHEVFEIIGKQ